MQKKNGLLMKIDLNSNFHSFSCHLHFLSTTVDYFRNNVQTSTNVKINQTCVAVANVSICLAHIDAIVTRDFDSTASDVKVSKSSDEFQFQFSPCVIDIDFISTKNFLP